MVLIECVGGLMKIPIGVHEFECKPGQVVGLVGQFKGSSERPFTALVRDIRLSKYHRCLYIFLFCFPQEFVSPS